MKKRGLILMIFGLAAMMSSCAGASQGSSEVDALNQEFVSNAIQNRVFRIEINQVYPMGGRTFQLNYPYSVTLVKDELDSFLPYFGRAYSIPYMSSEGLNFQAGITDYKVEMTRKGNYSITFTARTPEDIYRYSLELTPSGSAYLNVTPNRKQSISFGGTFDFSAFD